MSRSMKRTGVREKENKGRGLQGIRRYSGQSPSSGPVIFNNHLFKLKENN